MNEKARIVFVDDEKRVLNSMRGLFRREYELFLATAGADAVRLAVENDVDVIVADQRMPGMTGIEVLSEVREQSPRTVRILLTGYADPSAVEGSINQGEVFRFLSKPCPPQLLRETLRLAVDASKTAPAEAASIEIEVSGGPADEPQPTVSGTQPAATSETGRDEPRPVQVETPTSPAQVSTPPPRETAQPLADDSTQPALPALSEEGLADPSSSHWQTVTNVVMSEGSVEETQGQVSLSASAIRTRDIGVVVFTIDPDFATTAIRAVSEERTTVLATSLSKVAQAIEQNPIGVMVTDLTSNSGLLQKIIGTLKKHVPDLVTIVVNDGRDTTDMINLINFGQVFRYVLKPVDGAQLRSEINAAALRHLSLARSPASARRHHVQDAPQPGEPSESLNEFVGKITSFRRGKDPADTLV